MRLTLAPGNYIPNEIENCKIKFLCHLGIPRLFIFWVFWCVFNIAEQFEKFNYNYTLFKL